MPLNTPSFTSGERGRRTRGAGAGPGAEARGGPLAGGHRLVLPHPPLVISDAYTSPRRSKIQNLESKMAAATGAPSIRYGLHGGLPSCMNLGFFLPFCIPAFRMRYDGKTPAHAPLRVSW